MQLLSILSLKSSRQEDLLVICACKACPDSLMLIWIIYLLLFSCSFALHFVRRVLESSFYRLLHAPGKTLVSRDLCERQCPVDNSFIVKTSIEGLQWLQLTPNKPPPIPLTLISPFRRLWSERCIPPRWTAAAVLNLVCHSPSVRARHSIICTEEKGIQEKRSQSGREFRLQVSRQSKESHWEARLIDICI